MVGYLSVAIATLGDVGSRVGNQSTFLQENAELVAAFIGVLMVIAGVLRLRHVGQQQERDKAGFGLVVFGSLTFAVGVIIKLVLLSTAVDAAMAEFETSYGII